MASGPRGIWPSSRRRTWTTVFSANKTQRLQKMVTKDIGILYFGLPQSDDPKSVLYKDVLGPMDLDRMSEDF